MAGSREFVIFYSICLTNFTFELNPKLRRDIQLYDIEEGKVFSDKLNIILLQLPCLKAENLEQCNEYYEYLLFLLQEMQGGMKTVEQLKQEVAATTLPQATKDLFYKVLDTANVGELPENDRIRYESNLKNYMDTMSCIKFAAETGREEGRAEGKAEEKTTIAKTMKTKGIDIVTISECTGLSVEQIEAL